MPDVMLEVGLAATVTATVEPAMLASAVGSGTLAVLATPWLVALVERAACAALEGHLPDGHTSVGTHIDLIHLAATPLGAEVRARAEVVEIDGRRLVFRVEAFDTQDKIGEGTHERSIVDAQRLLDRANAKR